MRIMKWPLMSGNAVFLELVLHQALGNAQKIGGLGLNEIRPDQSAADQRRLHAFQGIRQIKLYREQIDRAFELRFLDRKSTRLNSSHWS